MQHTTVKTGVRHREARLKRAAKGKDRQVVGILSTDKPALMKIEGRTVHEVLSHSPGSIDLSRLQKGVVPFLYDHDQTKVIGKVEKLSLDNGKARGIMRFGLSELAEEAYQDIIIAGTRNALSVGYIVHEYKVSEPADPGDLPTYTATKWELLECSSVGVPLDANTGIGRSSKDIQIETIIKTRSKKMKTDNKLKNADIKNIIAIGQNHGFMDEAAKAVADDTPVEEFRSFVLDKMSKRGLKPMGNSSDYPTSQPGSTAIADAILASLPNSKKCYGAGLALERSQELSQQFGKKPEGIFVPLGNPGQRSLTVGTATAGGNTVSTDLLAASFIDVLRANSMVLQLGATVLAGLVGDVAIPRQTGSATAYYVAESGSITNSDQSFDQVAMAPNTIGARTSISRKLLLQSAIDIEQFVKNDLAKVLGSGIDMAAINGSGSSNQPTGILNTTGIGDVAGGTNGLAPTFGNMVDLQSTVADANALMGNLGYLTTPGIIGKLMQTEKASGTAKFVVEQMPNGEGLTNISGIKAGVSNNVPSDLTKGTSSGVCHAIIYGNWADLLVGMWGVLDIIVDPYTNSDKGQLNITAFIDFDIAVRHAESFAAMQDALVS